MKACTFSNSFSGSDRCEYNDGMDDDNDGADNDGDNEYDDDDNDDRDETCLQSTGQRARE